MKKSGPEALRAKKKSGYSPKRLTNDVEKVRTVYANLGRNRFAVYEYWNAVYGLRRKWRRLQKKNGVKVKRIIKRVANAKVPSSSGDDLLRWIIDATMITASASTRLSKSKSKYFSLLNYAYKQRVRAPELEKFIKDRGGLNFST